MSNTFVVSGAMLRRHFSDTLNKAIGHYFVQLLPMETLIKSNSPRSNEHTHAAEFDTLRFNQRIPRFDQL